jgi:hypothetical protein
MGIQVMTTAAVSEPGRSARPPASPTPCAGRETRLPLEVERLLLDVVAEGFVLHCCGPKNAPFALVASYQWKDYADLVTIRQFNWITTARVCTQPGRIDTFAPTVVVWAYEGPPQWALPTLLELVHPEHPDAPSSAYPAPPSLHIPRSQQRPMTIRLPPPGRAGIRAARLAAAISLPDSEPIRSLTGTPG